VSFFLNDHALLPQHIHTLISLVAQIMLFITASYVDQSLIEFFPCSKITINYGNIYKY